MKTKTEKRLLLSEDSKAITEAEKLAKQRAGYLNSIAKVFDFETEIEFMHRTNDLEKMVRAAMLKRPALKALSEQVEVSALKVPQDIGEARKVIEYLLKIEGLFSHLSHDGNKWIADTTKLEAYAESKRIYAIGATQIKKYEGAKAYSKILNELHLGFGPFEKAGYHSILVEFNLSKNEWQPNLRWVIN